MNIGKGHEPAARAGVNLGPGLEVDLGPGLEVNLGPGLEVDLGPGLETSLETILGAK